MMRKTSLILLGAAAGAALTLMTTQPHFVLDASSAKAAGADTYKQLSLFGDVFERVRADYVEKPDDGKLIETAISGMRGGLAWKPICGDASSSALWVRRLLGRGLRARSSRCR